MKKLLTLSASLVSTLLLAAPVFAQTSVDPCPNNSNSQYHVLCTLNPGNALPFIFTWIIIIGIVLALAFLIWGGIKWILSGGDKTKVEGARSTIIAAIVGLLIIFLSWFIINVIIGVFFNGNLTNGFQLPQIQSGSGQATNNTGSRSDSSDCASNGGTDTSC